MTKGESDVRADTAAGAGNTTGDLSAVAGSDGTARLTQAQVAHIDDDLLCGVFLSLQDEVKSLRDSLGLVDWEIRRRLADRTATVIGERQYALVLRPGAVRNAYLPEWLEALKEHVGVDKWNEVMRPHVELDVDKRALNDLAKRGGVIAAIITEAVVETRGEGKLERAKQ